MDFSLNQVVEIINQYAPAPLLLVLGLLGSLAALGSLIILVTPTKADDDWLSKLKSKPYVGIVLNVLLSFSFIQKKEGKIKLSNE